MLMIGNKRYLLIFRPAKPAASSKQASQLSGYRWYTVINIFLSLR